MASMLRRWLKKSSFVNKVKWELEYLTGTWKFLDSSTEDGRFRNIIDIMHEFCVPSPVVLEMGCGEGLLLKKMEDFSYAFFAGVDLSGVAIRRAMAKNFKNAVFRTGNMDSWTADRKFDVIIFNESVYYSKDPVELMARYGGWLNPNGRMIISIYIMGPTQPVLDKILKVYQPLDFKKVENEMGVWQEYIFSADTIRAARKLL